MYTQVGDGPSPGVLGGMMAQDNINDNRPVDRKAIRSLCDALVEFRALNPAMPVGLVQMFLLVALNGGASQADLAIIGDMKKSTASRYLLDLSDKTRKGGVGYGLVIRDTDPQELRRNMYALSPKGRHMVRRLTVRATGGNVGEA